MCGKDCGNWLGIPKRVLIKTRLRSRLDVLALGARIELEQHGFVQSGIIRFLLLHHQLSHLRVRVIEASEARDPFSCCAAQAQHVTSLGICGHRHLRLASAPKKVS
ncbi:hypothetical protein KEM55_002772, partial [Ascosphaera atra]